MQNSTSKAIFKPKEKILACKDTNDAYLCPLTSEENKSKITILIHLSLLLTSTWHLEFWTLSTYKEEWKESEYKNVRVVFLKVEKYNINIEFCFRKKQCTKSLIASC